nr:ABC transporter permease [Gordonia asplenii]
MITVVVALLGVLVAFLGGLTAGLARQNISAVQALPGTHVVVADDGAPASFDRSQLTDAQVDATMRADRAALPVGISRGTVEAEGRVLPVAVFGMPPEATPDAVRREHGTIRLSAAAADSLGVRAGDRVTVGAMAFTVDVDHADRWYSHTPVAYVALADWRLVNPQSGAATVVTTASSPAVGGTVALTRDRALSAIGSYDSEHRSLQLMTVMLFAISALVVGSFFVVWTMQRIGDIATLKALGAATRTLVVDALGQAALVLGLGVTVGTGLAAAVGVAVGGAVPFEVSASTTLLPATLLIVLGLAGSVVALRFLITTDPLTALNAAR